MIFGKKKKDVPRITFQDQLDAEVIYNQNIKIEQETETYVRVRVSLKLTGFSKFYSRFFPIRDYHSYILSDFSLRLFRLIRSESHTVGELVRYLCDLEKLSFFESRNLMIQYIGGLMRRGIVVVKLPDDPHGGENSESEQ